VCGYRLKLQNKTTFDYAIFRCKLSVLQLLNRSLYQTKSHEILSNLGINVQNKKKTSFEI